MVYGLLINIGNFAADPKNNLSDFRSFILKRDQPISKTIKCNLGRIAGESLITCTVKDSTVCE